MNGEGRPAMAEVATKGQVIVRHGREGEALWAVGSLFMVKLAVEESGGPLSVMRVVSLPGGATPPARTPRGGRSLLPSRRRNDLPGWRGGLRATNRKLRLSAKGRSPSVPDPRDDASEIPRIGHAGRS